MFHRQNVPPKIVALAMWILDDRDTGLWKLHRSDMNKLANKDNFYPFVFQNIKGFD